MDAVDQIVNYTFKGGELAFRITGAAAKNLAVLVAALMKDTHKTSGKTRMARMYREGKEQKVITIPDGKLPDFDALAKQYGVLYCVINDKTVADGMDLVVKAEDAEKINRIYSRLNWGNVNTVAEIKPIDQKEAAKAAGNIITIPEPTFTALEQDLINLEYQRDDLEELKGTVNMHEEMIREVEREPDRFPEAEIEGMRNQVAKAKAALQEKFGLDYEDAKKEIQKLELRIESIRKEERETNPTPEPDRSGSGSDGIFQRNSNSDKERVSIKKRLEDVKQRLQQQPKAKAPKRSRSKAAIKEQ